MGDSGVRSSDQPGESGRLEEKPEMVLISRHVVLSEEHSQYACIHVRDSFITDIVVVSEDTPVHSTQIEDLIRLYTDSQIIDCEQDYILPGLLDLNVRPDRADTKLAETTKAALSGGVTFVLQETSDSALGNSDEELYVDVGSARVMSPTEPISSFDGVFAIKTQLFQPNLVGNCTEEILSAALSVSSSLHLPLLLDLFLPPLTSSMVNTPFRALPMTDRQHRPLPTLDPAAFADAPSTPPTAHTSDPIYSIVESDDFVPLKRSTTDAPSLVAIAHEAIKRRKTTKDKDIQLLSQMEQWQYADSGVTTYEKSQKVTPSAAENARERLKSRLTTLVTAKSTEAGVTRKYLSYLAYYPDSSEVDGVPKLATALEGDFTSHVHVLNVSSEGALAVLSELKRERGLMTIETESHFLYFSAEAIEDGNTLLKCTPPIREEANRKLLIEGLKTGSIDCIGSGHVGFAAEQKDLTKGNFKRAVSGVAGLGYALQAVWTACKGEDQAENDGLICRLVRAMAARPAEIIGLKGERGRIETGKFADLVVWRPYEVMEVEEGLHPYGREQLYGAVKRVFLRGQEVYHAGVYSAKGRREMRVLSQGH